ncbi:MAG: ribonuclease P protein component [Lysobacteraceae bacterium]
MTPGLSGIARYPRSARVRARPEFDAVFAGGRRAANALLALHHLGDDRPARLGLAVSRKVDRRAVVRNRIKRVLRDRFRHLRPGLPGGAYVIVARSGAARASGIELGDALRQALRRLALPPSKAGGTMPPAAPSSAQAPRNAGATDPFPT